MKTLIFDIETVGEDWNSLDETTQSVLTRWVEQSSKSEEEKTAGIKGVQEGLGFSPLTGFVVAIALYDLERGAGVVYYTGKGSESDEEVLGYTLKQRSEEEMLKDFWEGAKSYDTFVTFNGRGFDVPFLLHRSVARGIKPTVSLMDGRYLYQQRGAKHIDLQDQLTFYGAMQKRPNLHLFCRAFGIESPKAEGVAGDDVAELFSTEKFRDIALYNSRDVTATTELYKKWRDFLA